MWKFQIINWWKKIEEIKQKLIYKNNWYFIYSLSNVMGAIIEMITGENFYFWRWLFSSTAEGLFYFPLYNSNTFLLYLSLFVRKIRNDLLNIFTLSKTIFFVRVCMCVCIYVYMHVFDLFKCTHRNFVSNLIMHTQLIIIDTKIVKKSLFL